MENIKAEDLTQGQSITVGGAVYEVLAVFKPVTDPEAVYVVVEGAGNKRESLSFYRWDKVELSSNNSAGEPASTEEPASSESPIMSTADAAKRLGYTTARINQLIQAGKIDTRGRLTPRGAWLVSRASVERFAELKNKRIKK